MMHEPIRLRHRNESQNISGPILGHNHPPPRRLLLKVFQPESRGILPVKRLETRLHKNTRQRRAIFRLRSANTNPRVHSPSLGKIKRTARATSPPTRNKSARPPSVAKTKPPTN